MEYEPSRQQPSHDCPRPLYEPPQIVSYSDDQLLAALGPAQAHTSSRCITVVINKKPRTWCKPRKP